MGNTHILFDLSSAQLGYNNGFHGGGEYAKVVFYRLCEMLPDGVSLEVFYNPNKDIENSILEICKARKFVVNFCCTNLDIGRLLCEKNFNAFYSALPYSYFDLVIPAKTKFIYTIHGLRHLEYPFDKYMLKYRKNNIKEITKYILFSIFPSFLKKYALKKDIDRLNKLFSLTENQTIITISNHSKFAIAYFFPKINISQLEVLYSPLKECKLDINNDTEIMNSFSLKPDKYILLTGGDRIEKGAYRACRVLHKLIEQCRIPENIRVIVLGLSHRASYLKVTNNSRRFEFRGYVAEETLETLYKNAYLFLYPTLNEGFGYPPLEAMKYRTICACSANSAVTEVYGDSVLYFNPHDETEMSIRILQSFDENIRKEKKEKIISRYQLIREKQEQDLNLLIQKITS